MKKNDAPGVKTPLFDRIFKPEIITLENGHTVARPRSRTPLIALLVIVLTFAGCAAIDTLRTRFIMQPLQRSRAFTAFCVKGDALAAEIEKQSD